MQGDRKPAAELAARFSRECRALARIDHPGVVAIHDAGRDPDHNGGELYLVMQRIDRMSPADFIAENEQIPWWQAAALGAQVATILAAVHAIPVVHRDLKPSNVMLRPDGTAVLLDLGIAAVFDPELSRLTRTGESLGSPGYMAPEQAASGLAGPHSDLYALGCVLHEVLTCHPVFSARTPSQCREQAGEISAALAEYQAILPAYAALANHDPGKTLAVRDRIGKLLIATGRPREAWPVLLGLLQDQERMLGPHHPDTLALRSSLHQLNTGSRPR